MRIDTRLLLWMNGFFKKPNFPERPTPHAYAEWEYNETAAQLAVLRELGFTPAGGRLLDLGCGLGGKTVYLAEHTGMRLVGIDIGRDNIRAAQSFASVRNAKVSFARADATSLPFRDNSLDALIATDVFEHFSRPEIALKEVARILRPGGLAGISFGPWGSPLGSHLYDRIFTPWCHLLFSSGALAEALRHLARERTHGMSADQRAEELKQTEEQIRYYNEDVNRMSLRRFAGDLRGVRELEIVGASKLANRKLRMFQRLIGIPGLDEVLTGMFSICLRKRPA